MPWNIVIGWNLNDIMASLKCGCGWRHIELDISFKWDVLTNLHQYRDYLARVSKRGYWTIQNVFNDVKWLWLIEVWMTSWRTSWNYNKVDLIASAGLYRLNLSHHLRRHTITKQHITRHKHSRAYACTCAIHTRVFHTPDMGGGRWR